MAHQSELSFLRSILKKHHVNSNLYDLNEFLSSNTLNLDDGFFVDEGFSNKIFPPLLNKTLYRAVDGFERTFLIALIKVDNQDKVLCIGPFLQEKLLPAQIIDVCSKTGISTQKQHYLLEYYDGLKILNADDAIYGVIHTFFEREWDTENYKIQDVSRTHDYSSNHSIFNQQDTVADTIINIKALEKRYAFENEMIRAVSLGKINLEKTFSSAFSPIAFEKRTTDSLRNVKNYGVIMNTLLRKAAEQGGVHPMYLDKISSSHARNIENCSSTDEAMRLMPSILKSYCDLVRERSVENYPLIVKNTTLIIDSDVSAELSPQILAKEQNVSLGYLSSIFKKSTGLTICEYIRKRRVEHAVYLLKTTNLQIQTIASNCGIVDVQYFSKQFRKETGLSPTEFKKKK